MFLESSTGDLPFLVAHSDEDFIDKTAELFFSKDLWEATAKASIKHAHQHFSISSQAYELESAISNAFRTRHEKLGEMAN